LKDILLAQSTSFAKSLGATLLFQSLMEKKDNSSFQKFNSSLERTSATMSELDKDEFIRKGKSRPVVTSLGAVAALWNWLWLLDPTWLNCAAGVLRFFSIA
jgi:hypothetical protein